MLYVQYRNQFKDYLTLRTLPNEAILGDLVLYRWIYLYERYYWFEFYAKGLSISIFKVPYKRLRDKSVKDDCFTDADLLKAHTYILLNYEEVMSTLFLSNKWVSDVHPGFNELHTRLYGNGRVTQNSDVCVKGSVHNDGVSDYYGMSDEVLEAEYHSESARSVVA
ncbi:hypothetical protein CTI12_AA240220 [Artemisia annua]|uniref:Uncharacterized protein n=1 Tax=Artemisia annua TaxID=35608 RepID=A0A2U1NQ85_ARTAN|nr:hypothetical protein CTI12_AA240220 [Artemisia annua]